MDAARLRAPVVGISRVGGYAIGTVLLAAASLVSVPAMIDASGPQAWGSIATGQAVGAVAAVVLAFGWGVAGPARIARARTSPVRHREFVESITTRAVLAVPVMGAGMAVAYLVVPHHALLAALGALSASSVGLTLNWYFIGLSRPFLLLTLETAPRVVGTLLGVMAMALGGHGAAAGIVGQLGGMLTGVALSAVWIMATNRDVRSEALANRPLKVVVAANLNGVASSAVSQLYNAVPIVIVGLVAPAAQPSFAVLDKLHRQIASGQAAYVTMMQGWVPRASDGRLRSRVRSALRLTGVGALVLGLCVAAFGEWLLTWLSDGQLGFTFVEVVLLGAVVAVGLLGSVLARACLPALDELALMARATAVGAVMGIALVALLAPGLGSVGALTGVLAGYVVKVILALVGVRRGSQPTAQAVLSTQPPYRQRRPKEVHQ